MRGMRAVAASRLVVLDLRAAMTGDRGRAGLAAGGGAQLGLWGDDAAAPAEGELCGQCFCDRPAVVAVASERWPGHWWHGCAEHAETVGATAR